MTLTAVRSNNVAMERLYASNVLIWEQETTTPIRNWAFLDALARTWSAWDVEGYPWLPEDEGIQYDRTVEVSDWAGLRNAVTGAVSGERTQIIVLSNMSTDLPAGVLTVAAGRDVTITSSGSVPFILKRYTLAQRHFSVTGILRLRNIELHGDSTNHNSNHGGILVNPAGHLFMEPGSAIRYCRWSASGHGAAVSVNGGVFTMNSGEVSHNASLTGTAAGFAAVHVAAAGVFTLNNGRLHDNTGRFGGAVALSSATTFEVSETRFIMNGGELYKNTSLFGGGVNVERGTFEFNAGTIHENSASALPNTLLPPVATGRGGGGVFTQNAGQVVMRGGEIVGNDSANHGGGIMVTAGTSFTMRNGVIDGNTASGNGQNVWTVGTGVFNHLGGVVGQ